MKAAEIPSLRPSDILLLFRRLCWNGARTPAGGDGTANPLVGVTFRSLQRECSLSLVVTSTGALGTETHSGEALLSIHEGSFLKINDVDEDIDTRKGGVSCTSGHYTCLFH